MARVSFVFFSEYSIKPGSGLKGSKCIRWNNMFVSIYEQLRTKFGYDTLGSANICNIYGTITLFSRPGIMELYWDFLHLEKKVYINGHNTIMWAVWPFLRGRAWWDWKGEHLLHGEWWMRQNGNTFFRLLSSWEFFFFQMKNCIYLWTIPHWLLPSIHKIMFST